MEETKRYTRANQALRELIEGYYMGAKMAEFDGRPIAWSTAIAPAEFLQAMGIIPIYPENHGAMIGARKMGVELAEAAEARGYSADICSYARGDFGAIYTGKSPVQGLPRPNLLVCCNNTCGTVMKWYENLSRHFQVPLILIDTPFNHGPGVSRASIDYIKSQFRNLIQVCEQVTGRSWDEDRFRQVVEVANETSELWRQCLETAARRPSPLTAFQAFNYMAPIVVMRGTEAARDFYRLLLEELQEKVADGYGAVRGEKYRFMWDGIPVWFDLKHMSDTFKQYGVSLVCSSYTDAWILEFDPQNPLESMAQTYTSVMINRSLDDRVDYVTGLVRKYHLDGIIHHSNRSCKPACFGVYDADRMLQRRMALPTLIIDGDQCDARAYSEAQFNTRLEAFMETLEPAGEEGF